MLDILNVKYSTDVIREKRKEITEILMSKSARVKDGVIRSLSTEELSQLFCLYDRIFFMDWFKENFKGRLKFSLSRRMTKSAGLTICPKNPEKIKPEDLTLEIRIGVDFFLQYETIQGSKSVGGIEAGNSLEALQLVFEHELCHVIEFINYKKSNCKGKRFKKLAENLFGHTESCHRLPTQRQIARQKLGLNIGDMVSFEFKGKRMTGILYNINKRATIMVKNSKGAFIDNRGNRYSKYYIPLNLLQ